jgi:hypothetical protein
MTCGSQYAPQLRARGFRMTSQRLAILHVLCHAGTHLSPSEVYKQAKQDLPGLTEPTVYRTLEFLAENGLARPAPKQGTVTSHMRLPGMIIIILFAVCVGVRWKWNTPTWKPFTKNWNQRPGICVLIVI